MHIPEDLYPKYPYHSFHDFYFQRSRIEFVAARSFAAMQGYFFLMHAPIYITHLGNLYPLINYAALYHVALSNPTKITGSRPAHSTDSPYLLFIARQRQNLGELWHPTHLKLLPLDEDLVQKATDEMGGIEDLLITAEDLKIFGEVSFLLYKQMVLKPIQENFFGAMQMLFSIEEHSELINDVYNLCNFCGVFGKFREFNINGGFQEVSYKKIMDTIPDLSLTMHEEKSHYQEALQAVSTLDLFEFKTIQSVYEGKPVIIPAGYTDGKRGHHIDILFYKDYFFICDRGAKAPQSIIESYQYDLRLLNSSLFQYLILNALKEIHPSTCKEHVITYLYTVLPKILIANKIEEKEPHLNFKEQKYNNCTKASSITAFKVFIYLKRLEMGYSQREAAWLSKLAGDELSIKLRQETIHKVEKAMPELSLTDRKELEVLLDKAKEITKRKEHASFCRKRLQAILPELDEDISTFVETALLKEKGAKQTIASRKKHHPLLILIAFQRADLKEKWDPSMLRLLPLCVDKCEKTLQELTEASEEKEIILMPEDFKIFSAIREVCWSNPFAADLLSL
jgi:hypothetical protein